MLTSHTISTNKLARNLLNFSNLSGWQRFLKSLKTSMTSLILCETMAMSGAMAGTAVSQGKTS